MNSPIAPPSPLDAHLGYRLRQASNAISQAFARRLEESGITVAEWVVLRSLFDTEALAPSRLAEAMGMTRGAISKLADRLVGKGLVRRLPHPGDGRAHGLALTPAGRDRVPALAAAADANDAAFFGALRPEDRAALERILRGLAARHGWTRPPTE